MTPFINTLDNLVKTQRVYAIHLLLYEIHTGDI